jgi:hypothetical protein
MVRGYLDPRLSQRLAEEMVPEFARPYVGLVAKALDAIRDIPGDTVAGRSARASAFQSVLYNLVSDHENAARQREAVQARGEKVT